MESYTIESNKKKSRLPARLDFLQSGTGLILGLFMWVHMMLVGSIILGKGAFNWVAKTMELAFLSETGHGYPIAVFFAVSVIFTLFITHALLGMRKFPISWKQHRIMRDQMVLMKHQDTNLWYIQAITGFIMFFAGSVHLYIMLTNPGSIDPYLSADRIVSGNMWFVYLVLLICVELHGTIGLYRLAMKWGWFNSKDHKGAIETRKKLKQLKNRLTIFFLSVGILALLVFIVIGIGHKDQVGQRYDAAAGAAVTVETADEDAHSVEEAAPAADDAAVHETEAVEAEVHDAEAPGEAAHATKDGHQAEEANEVGTPEAAHGTEDAGHDTADTADQGTEAPDAHGTDAHSAEETH